jgi:hypothetical protein
MTSTNIERPGLNQLFSVLSSDILWRKENCDYRGNMIAYLRDVGEALTGVPDEIVEVVAAELDYGGANWRGKPDPQYFAELADAAMRVAPVLSRMGINVEEPRRRWHTS